MSDRYHRRDALKLLGRGALGLSLSPLLGSSCASAPSQGGPRQRPNILFILTDDQTQGAMSGYGNTILKTPNMDRIGDEGIRFEQAFVTSSLCVPSRASYLTGQYPHRHGLLTQGKESGFDDQPPLRNSDTWPMLLRQAGYRAAVIGKWHIETPPQGYDYAAVLPGHGEYFDPAMIVNGRMTRQQGHCDDVIADLSLQFLRAQSGEQPFCLLCQFKAPHRDWEPAPRFTKAFEDIEIPIPATFAEPAETRPLAVRKSEMRIADMPDFRKRGVPATLPPDERTRANHQALVKHYYRVLLGVDENVGRLLAYLDDAGLAGNTIVVYASDNGFFLGEHGLFDKRLMYEPSIRVPMLLRWPAAIEPRVDDRHMVLNIDVAPTLLELAGAPVPGTMQGTGWRPLLEEADPPWREDFLYEFFEFPAVHCVRKHRGVRNARWKLIHFWQLPQEWELYDLDNDPEERRNLAADPAHAAQLRTMQARLAELRSEFGDVDPAGYVPTRPDPGRCPV